MNFSILLIPLARNSMSSQAASGAVYLEWKGGLNGRLLGVPVRTQNSATATENRASRKVKRVYQY